MIIKWTLYRVLIWCNRVWLMTKLYYVNDPPPFFSLFLSSYYISSLIINTNYSHHFHLTHSRHFPLTSHFSLIEITMLCDKQYRRKCTNNIFWMHEYIVLCRRRWHRSTEIFSGFIVSQFTKNELRSLHLHITMKFSVHNGIYIYT